MNRVGRAYSCGIDTVAVMTPLSAAMGEAMTESEQVTFTAQAEAGDIVWSSVTLARSSTFGVAFGTFVLVPSIAAVWAGDLWLALPMAVFGISLVTGLFAAPFAWINVQRNRDALLTPTDVRADPRGVSLQSPGSSSSSSWSVYRRARDTRRAFLLDPGTGLVIVVPKRGVAESELVAFRGLLARAGLLEDASVGRTLLRSLRGFAVGIGIAIGLGAATVGISLLQANARIDLEVTVADGIAKVVGSTDLPDGSLVSVQVYQADEWRRRSADGQSPDVETFPWISGHDVTVVGGAFFATVDIDGWPSGKGGAIAQFWVDPAQPGAARERFGADGENLRGPHVGEFDDGTPRLRVYTPFEIP